MKVEKGFTLVEILIVVVILGILAAIVIPQFTSASTEARESALVSDLQAVRSQIELYKIQHLGDALPGAGTATFFEAMEGTTDIDGAVVAVGTAGAKGPYMQALPVNPFSTADPATNLVRMDGAAAGADTDHWRFDTTTGAFQADDAEVNPTTGDAHSTY
jgi:general secretion pathway protein G